MIVDHDQLLWAMAKVLKERREHLHLTQIDLAKLSGLHRSYITDYERGGRNMSVENLNRLASILDTTASNVIALAEKELATGKFIGPKKRRPRQKKDKRLTLVSATALLLRQRRETLRLTEAELAKLCGIPKTSIVGYESGQRKISLETMSKLALALDIKASKVVALAERRVAIEQSKRQST